MRLTCLWQKKQRDFDNDGRLDLLLFPNTGPPPLLHNEAPTANQKANHWITLAFVGTKSNREGYETRVRLNAGGIMQRDTVHSDSSGLANSDRRLHFGLGNAAKVDTVQVSWPSGNKEIYRSLEANKQWTITEGKPLR